MTGYSGWLFRQARDIRIVEIGNGTMAQRDRAFVEHAFVGAVGSVRAESLALCASKLTGGKVRETRTVYDRLSVAKQVAKGLLTKWLVGLVTKRAVEGLG